MAAALWSDVMVAGWIFHSKHINVELPHDVFWSDLEQSLPAEGSIPVICVIVVKKVHQGDQIALVLVLFVGIYQRRHGQMIDRR